VTAVKISNPYREPAERDEDEDVLLVANLTAEELHFWQSIFQIAMGKGHEFKQCWTWADQAVAEMRRRASENKGEGQKR
jgi:hypothetical protein